MKFHRNAVPVVIVGAGPYGLSLAANLRAKGVPFRIFGQPMQMWATQMPSAMRLKSDGFASNLSTGGLPYTLAEFCRETGRPCDQTQWPVTVADFVAYGQEFARRFVPNLETEDVRAIRSGESAFRVTTASGEQILAHRVVVASGVSSFQNVPAEFRHLPSSRVTHPEQHSDFSAFQGREVTVLGRGASSLNAAALLHEAGARVTLITRGRKIRIQQRVPLKGRSALQRVLRPSTPLGPGLRSLLACNAPDLLHLLPAAIRGALEDKLIEPTGGAVLEGRITGFPVLAGCRIHAIEQADGSGDRLRLTLTDRHGNAHRHLTSHLIAGTVFRIDLNRLRFLSAEIRDLLRVDAAGAPRLSRTFETSVRGLHLIGPIAAPSFGPLLRFVAGTTFVAERLSLHLQRAWLRERVLWRQRKEVRSDRRPTVSAFIAGAGRNCAAPDRERSRSLPDARARPRRPVRAPSRLPLSSPRRRACPPG